MKSFNSCVVLFVVLSFMCGCFPTDTPLGNTEMYFVQSEEQNTVYYKGQYCTGAVVDNPLKAKSAAINALLYSVDVDPNTGAVTSDIDDAEVIGSAAICGSNKIPLPMIPIVPVNANFKGTFTLDEREAGSITFGIDGDCQIDSLIKDTSKSAHGSLAGCDVEVAADESVELVGGRAVSNSIFGALTEEATGSFWTIRLVFKGEETE